MLPGQLIYVCVGHEQWTRARVQDKKNDQGAITLKTFLIDEGRDYLVTNIHCQISRIPKDLVQECLEVAGHAQRLKLYGLLPKDAKDRQKWPENSKKFAERVLSLASTVSVQFESYLDDEDIYLGDILFV